LTGYITQHQLSGSIIQTINRTCFHYLAEFKILIWAPMGAKLTNCIDQTVIHIYINETWHKCTVPWPIKVYFWLDSPIFWFLATFLRLFQTFNMQKTIGVFCRYFSHSSHRILSKSILKKPYFIHIDTRLSITFAHYDLN
jgi:hypothetical protein